MVKPTPSRFNPDLLARDSTLYSTNLPLGQFSRLREMLLTDEGEVNATFRFSRRKKSVLVAGNLKTSYRLLCTRCLEPMDYEIEEPFEFIFAKNEQVAHEMPDGFDPVVLDEYGQIHVVDLFEDELILHVPTVAQHDQKEICNASEQLLGANEIEKSSSTLLEQSEQGKNQPTISGSKKKNPFDVLKDLDLH